MGQASRQTSAVSSQQRPAGHSLRSGSQPERGGGSGSSSHRGGEPVQIWPGGHWALVAQVPPPAPWTVTSKATDAPAACARATTRQGPSAASEVTRKARASPPVPVRSVATGPETALKRERAA